MTIDMQAMAAELTGDEGLRLHVYDDATGKPIVPGTKVIGHPTIGMGRALDVHGISFAEADWLLSNDIESAVRDLSQFEWYRNLDPIRQRVLVNMYHNMGLQRLLGFHDMIAAIGEHRWNDAAAAGLLSEWHKECPSRSGRLMIVLRTGIALTLSNAASITPRAVT